MPQERGGETHACKVLPPVSLLEAFIRPSIASNQKKKKKNPTRSLPCSFSRGGGIERAHLYLPEHATRNPVAKPKVGRDKDKRP